MKVILSENFETIIECEAENPVRNRNSKIILV